MAVKKLCTYNLDGTLQKKVHKNGSNTFFHYDFLKRCIKEETFAPNGELIDARSKRFKGHHLLEDTQLCRLDDPLSL